MRAFAVRALQDGISGRTACLTGEGDEMLRGRSQRMIVYWFCGGEAAVSTVESCYGYCFFELAGEPAIEERRV